MYNQVMYWGFLTFIIAPVFEVLGHLFLTWLTRDGMCKDQNIYELVSHKNPSIFITAFFVLLARLLWLLSMAFMFWGFFFLER